MNAMLRPRSKRARQAHRCAPRAWQTRSATRSSTLGSTGSTLTARAHRTVALGLLLWLSALATCFSSAPPPPPPLPPPLPPPSALYLPSLSIVVTRYVTQRPQQAYFWYKTSEGALERRDAGRHAQTAHAPLMPPLAAAVPELGSCAFWGRARRLRAARRSQGGEVRPQGTQPLPRALEPAASKVADSAASSRAGGRAAGRDRPHALLWQVPLERVARAAAARVVARAGTARRDLTLTLTQNPNPKPRP